MRISDWSSDVCSSDLDAPDTHTRILTHSPTGRVPAPVDGEIRVWESLAICEYLAETCALPPAWPITPAARAMARAVSQEMPAGFADLRPALPFDACRPTWRVPMLTEAEHALKPLVPTLRG